MCSTTGWSRSSAPRSRMRASTGKVAEIEVRFDAFVAAITRDKDGDLVGGSMSDAVPANDIWTFQRDLKSRDPNWRLVETEEAA